MRISNIAVAESIDTRNKQLTVTKPYYEVKVESLPHILKRVMIGYSVVIESYETNRRFDIEIGLYGPDKEPIFKTGVDNVMAMLRMSDPHALQGSFCMGGPVQLEQAGIYEARITVDGKKANAVNFEVIVTGSNEST